MLVRGSLPPVQYAGVCVAGRRGRTFSRASGGQFAARGAPARSRAAAAERGEVRRSGWPAASVRPLPAGEGRRRRQLGLGARLGGGAAAQRQPRPVPGVLRLFLRRSLKGLPGDGATAPSPAPI